MALIRIASTGELPPGKLLQAEANGRLLAVCNDAGVIHAFDDSCPHHGGPLAQGNFVDGCIVCTWHAWEFNVERGEMAYNPEIRLRRFPVTVSGEDVFVEI